MAYTPKTWTTGETITAAELNAIEQGVQGAASVADTANTGLTSKVNSSTYTTGLAGKADYPAGGTDGQSLVKSGSTTAWATVSGGGAGAVTSVNSKTGVVTLTASDVGADASGAATAAQAYAVQRANHTGTQAASTVTGLATVATSGAYADLSGKPTIPASPGALVRAVTAAYAATITPNADTTDVLNVGALTGALTLANPTGTPADGQNLRLRLVQDATGSRAVSFGTAYAFGTDVTAALIPSAASAKWEMLFTWNATDAKWRATAIVRGF